MWFHETRNRRTDGWRVLWTAGWSSVPLSRSECGVSLRNASYRVKRSYPECKFVVWTALGRKHLILLSQFIPSQIYSDDRPYSLDSSVETTLLSSTRLENWFVYFARSSIIEGLTVIGFWLLIKLTTTRRSNTCHSNLGRSMERQLNQCFLVLDQHIHSCLDVGYDPVFRFLDSSVQDGLYLPFVTSQQANLYQQTWFPHLLSDGMLLLASWTSTCIPKERERLRHLKKVTFGEITRVRQRLPRLDVVVSDKKKLSGRAYVSSQHRIRIHARSIDFKAGDVLDTFMIRSSVFLHYLFTSLYWSWSKNLSKLPWWVQDFTRNMSHMKNYVFWNLI